MSSSVEIVRRALASDATKADLFRALEADPFDLGPVAELFPELAQEWQAVGNAMQVPWQFVMLLDLELAAALAPTAVLFPLPTLQIHAVLWWFLFHPGAFNTSAAVRLYSEVLQLIEQDINESRGERRRAWAEQHTAEADRARADGERRRPPGAPVNPFGGDVSICGGSGSLEGEGKIMALERNLSRSVHFLTEGKRLLQWLSLEGGSNQTIVLELFERLLWRRNTINGERSYVVPHPYFLAAGALHLEDVLELFVGADPLGIRGRLGLFYARATFKRAHEVRDAAAAISTQRRLTAWLSFRVFPPPPPA